ncbi:MAG: DUF7146 domain-containing protein [Tranquillimonas sp.]
MREDPRRDAALDVPITEVADRLGLTLRRVTAEEKAGPCPVCGGRDRFAINSRKSVFHCRACGEGGDAIALVQFARNLDYRAALGFLAGEDVAALDPAELERRRARRAADEQRRAQVAERERARAVADACRIWARAEGADPAPAAAYLAGRGITFAAWPPALRCLSDHPYRRKIGGTWVELHRGPCMVAAVQAPDGHLTAVHQTWIETARPGQKAAIRDKDGTAYPAKLVRGSKKGGAIRLTPPPARGGLLIMGEGIETTASAIPAAPGAAFWAGVDLGNMAGRQQKLPGRRHSGRPDMSDDAAFLPPPWTGQLIYLLDGDSDPTATRAKLQAGLRRARLSIPGLVARIAAAPAGQDFNDVLTGGRTDAGTDTAE